MTNPEGTGAADGLPTGVDHGRGDPVGWLETVRMAGADEDVRVAFFERAGSNVLVRQVDPNEPEPPRIPIYKGDNVQVMLAVSHLGHHTTPNVGETRDLLFGQRIVPVRREPGKIIARTLHRDEPDTGERVHVRPGDSIEFEAGGVHVELDYLDDQEPADEHGYVPLSPSLWTWFNLGEDLQPERTRYVLSAARRLDAANTLLAEVQRRRARILAEDACGPEIRRNAFRLIGEVELAVVGLGRAVDMVLRAHDLVGYMVPVPEQVTTSGPAINQIRNAYEHIEDRAVGNVRRQPHPDALSIFDFDTLIRDDVIAYGNFRLDLTIEIPFVVAEVRRYLKDAAIA